MKITRRTSRSFQFPMVLAAALVLAASSVGCVIDGSDSGPPPPTCSPLLVVPWAIFNNASCPPPGVSGPCTQPITCATAGAAGLDLDVNGTLADSPICPASSSTGFLQSLLGGAGTYEIDVYLVDATGGILSFIEAADVVHPLHTTPAES